MADSEAGVGLVKRPSVVVCRAAERLRYQEQLVALKSRRVDPFEVLGKLRIAQNALIKIGHDSAYGWSPANDVESLGPPPAPSSSARFPCISTKSGRFGRRGGADGA